MSYCILAYDHILRLGKWVTWPQSEQLWGVSWYAKQLISSRPDRVRLIKQMMIDALQGSKYNADVYCTRMIETQGPPPFFYLFWLWWCFLVADGLIALHFNALQSSQPSTQTCSTFKPFTFKYFLAVSEFPWEKWAIHQMTTAVRLRTCDHEVSTDPSPQNTFCMSGFPNELHNVSELKYSLNFYRSSSNFS